MWLPHLFRSYIAERVGMDKIMRSKTWMTAIWLEVCFGLFAPMQIRPPRFEIFSTGLALY